MREMGQTGEGVRFPPDPAGGYLTCAYPEHFHFLFHIPGLTHGVSLRYDPRFLQIPRIGSRDHRGREYKGYVADAARQEADMIAYNMPVTNALKDSVLYCGLRQISHQVLVQRAGRRHAADRCDRPDRKAGDSTNELKYRERMNNLNNELGGI